MTTDERFADMRTRLQRTVRVNYLLLFLLLALSLMSLWDRRSTKRVIRASEFVVVNDQGEDCAWLGTTADGAPKLGLAVDGKARAAFEITKDGMPRLILKDSAGERRGEFSLTNDMRPQLVLFDGEGTSRAGLALFADGSPAISLRDAKGKDRTIIVVDKQGQGILQYDAIGKCRGVWSEGVDDHSFFLKDTEGRSRAMMGIHNSKGPFFKAFDETGKEIWSAP